MTIVMGMNDSFFLGPGWHASTSDERYGLPYRPTAGRSEIQLPVKGRLLEISILVASSPPMLGKPVKARIRLNDRLAGQLVFRNDLWHTWRLDVAGLDAPPRNSGHHILEFIVTEPFVPNTRLKNGDHREMGLFISSIRCQLDRGRP